MGAHGERLLGVRGCVSVVFTVLHGLWAFSVVVRLVSGSGCVVWLKYFSVLKILVNLHTRVRRWVAVLRATV